MTHRQKSAVEIWLFYMTHNISITSSKHIWDTGTPGRT